MISCKLNFDDFKKVFDFSTNYHLSGKSLTDRTNGNPRNLGAIMDAFSIGKLTEIGISKILHNINKNKNFGLDFDIHEANNEPDIIKIEENNEIRDVNCFVEIKNTHDNDRWIGLTEEQFQSIKRASRDKEIFIIYAKLITKTNKEKQKTDDLTGMFLNEIEDKKKSFIFEKYSNINAEINIEFILTNKDFDKFGFYFERGMDIYDTNIFEIKKNNSIFKTDGNFVKNVSINKEYNDYNGKIELNIKEKTEKIKNIYTFNINGSFIIYNKNKSKLIKCITNLIVENDVFGKFELLKDNIYSFNINTLGRDSELKRNNIFIAKRRIYQLMNKKLMEKPDVVINKIANKI